MHKLTDFMCKCRPEGLVKCEACLNRVKHELKADDSNLLDKIVYNMQWELAPGYTANIERIVCDMWAGISAKVFYYEEDEEDESDEGSYKDHAEIYVQCDKIEHGIARVWELVKQACELDRPQPANSTDEN